jgi:TonB-linked SusC/RagA family outer membrane protein
MRANKSGTDWFDEIFDPVLTHSHQLALSGATEKSNYAVTFNYFDNKGILLNSFFKRYSIRANTEFKITPWLRVGENLQFAYTRGNSVSDHTDQNVIANLFRTSPLLPMYDIGGNLAGANGAPPEMGDNPVIGRVYAPANKGYTARMLGSAYLEVEPLKNLVLQTQIAIDYTPFQSRLFQDTLPQVRFPVTTFRFQEFSGHSLEWRTTNKISYTLNIDEVHKLNAFAAYEASEYTYRGVGAMSDSMLYALPGFQIVSPSTGVRWQVSGGQDKITYISVLGNINYSLLDKYLASVTYRRDGSSKFGALNKYGNFPSVSVGWRVSAEKFMENIHWLNDLKLRAAIGTSGNESSLPPGATLNTYYTDPAYTYYDLNGANGSSMLGFALTQLGNPFLQWEINKTTNLGFDAYLFSNRLSVSFNWFNRKTDKLIFNPPVTALQGDASAPWQNIMNFTNKGIELEVAYYGPKSKGLNYDINFNIGTYRNKVTYIDGRPETVILGGLYARQVNLSRSMAGMPVGSFYGWIYDGMIQDGDSAGHFRFKDISGPAGKPDGIVNDNDRTFIGNPHPKFTFGLAVSLYYKNFDFNLFVQGVSGNKIFNYWRAFTEWPGMYGAGSKDTWSEDNRDAKLPIYSNRDLDDDRPSTFFVEDGSYLRLKSMQLGYTFQRIKGISKLRVYAQAYNLLTITNYSGMDPEVNTGAPGSTGIDFGGNFPIAAKLLLGVNFGL